MKIELGKEKISFIMVNFYKFNKLNKKKDNNNINLYF